MLSIQEQVPAEVIDAYQIDPSSTSMQLSGGLVNQTLLITGAQGGKSILQRLSGELNPLAFRDADTVGNYLHESGWEVPKALPTAAGQPVATDNAGALWRQLQYIDSDCSEPKDGTADLMYAAGDMLGRWHRAVRELEYRPKFGIPNFHDTLHYAKKLNSYTADLPDIESRELSALLLAMLRASESLPDAGDQIIHGDPKWNNILFRDGVPFTLIDFDTIMHGSSWIDVGDFLRSAIGKRVTTQHTAPLDVIEPFTEGYMESAQLDLSKKDALYRARLSTARIAAELGMRYMCDIVEGSYFTWDPSTYDSRRDSHYSRAQLQLQIANMTSQATLNDITGGN